MSAPGISHEPERTELPPRRRTPLRSFSSWLEQAHALKAWVAQARKRSAALDATFETIKRDSDIGGVMLAGALSYRLFVFALPLAFFVVSGLGLLASAFGVEPHVIANSVGLAGVVTKQVADAAKAASNWWVALTSFCVLVYATRVLLPGRRDHPLAGVEAHGRLGQGQHPFARCLRRDARHATRARRRHRRRRPPDGDRRHRRTRGL